MRGMARAALAGAIVVAAAGPTAFVTGPATALATHAKPPPSHHQVSNPPPQHSNPPPPAQPPGPVANCPAQSASATHLSGEVWAQQDLQFSSVWNLTRGQHVTVAVVDTGVDRTPQLLGRVTPQSVTGADLHDCVGHGTAVASIIAASDERNKNVPFYGVAPGAHILSIKVSSEGTGSSSLLAEGIHQAAAEHAGVINVSICTTGNTPALRDAVAYAERQNAVVVAAAGNDGENPACTGGPFYPASYPGVLSVAAVDSTGTVTSYSGGRGTPISVAAPGENITTGWPGGFMQGLNGTSFAAAFVSGEAALIRSAFPTMTAAQVVNRIEQTADGAIGEHSGYGIINPVEAVSAVLPAQPAPPPAGVQPVSVPAVPRANPFTRTVAVSVTAGGVAAALLIVAIAVVVPRGRRRGWKPSRVDLKAIGSAPAEPGSDWGDEAEEMAAPKRRGLHARSAAPAGEVAARPAPPTRAPS